MFARAVHNKIMRPATQALAVDLLFFLPELREPLLRAVEALCLGAAYPPALAGRAVDVLSARVAAALASHPNPNPTPTPEDFAALLAALLAGRPAGGAAMRPGLGSGLDAPGNSDGAAEGAEGGWNRAVAVVSAACAALSASSPPGAPHLSLVAVQRCQHGAHNGVDKIISFCRLASLCPPSQPPLRRSSCVYLPSLAVHVSLVPASPA